MRNLAGIVLLLWVLSSGSVLLHVHEHCCCGHGHEQPQKPEQDEGPCSICLALDHVPISALARAEAFEARQDVAVWISPWIAIVSEEVFFDRPLARGPPSVS